MKSVVRIIPWAVLLIPFVVLVLLYDRITSEVLVMRSFFGDETLSAPKSLFTVFRVPLIEVVCAAAIEIIRPKTPLQNEPFSVWNILLYAVAFKSLFQVCEFVSLSVFSSPGRAELFFYLTAAVVFVGICLAVIKGRKIFKDFRKQEWALPPWKNILLAILLAAYLFLAFAPVVIFK